MNTPQNTPLPPAIRGIYYPSISVYGATSARLSWTEGGYIALELIEGTDTAPVTKEAFRVKPGEIQKVSSTPGALRLVLASGVYRMDSLAYADAVVQPIPPEYKGDPITMWLSQLSGHGVEVSRTRFGKLFLISACIAVGIIAVVALIVYFVEEL